MVLKKNVGKHLQYPFPDLWSDMNDLKEHIDQKIFEITSLKNVVKNLTITDLQHKIHKVQATVKAFNKQMQHQFDYWKAS